MKAQKCGRSVTWTMAEDLTLTIAGTGEMAPFYNRMTAPRGNAFLGMAEQPFAWKRARKVILTEGITAVGEGAFCQCPDLTEVFLPSTIREIGKAAFCDCDLLNKIDLPEGLSAIGPMAFGGCANLADVRIPSTVRTIGDAAFMGCAVTRMVLPEGIREIGTGAFRDCGMLAQIILPPSLQQISEALFAGCKSLAAAGLPEGIFRIGEYAFMCCRNLSEITLPSSVTFIGMGAFNGCSRLREVTLPERLSEIGSGLFFQCERLTRINVPETGPVSGKGSHAAGIKFPQGIARIGRQAFSYCAGLGEVVIPEGVECIEDSAFADSGLTAVSLPASLRRFGKFVFSGCRRLERITVDPANPVFDSRGGCNAIIETATDTLLEGCQKTFIPDSVARIGGCAYLDFDENTCVAAGTKRTAEMLDEYPVSVLYTGGPLWDLDDEVKEQAFLGFLSAYKEGDPSLRKWQDSYIDYVRRRKKKYLNRAQKKKDLVLVRWMMEWSLIPEERVDGFIELAVAEKQADLAAGLLEYKEKHFGPGGNKELDV